MAVFVCMYIFQEIYISIISLVQVDVPFVKHEILKCFFKYVKKDIKLEATHARLYYHTTSQLISLPAWAQSHYLMAFEVERSAIIGPQVTTDFTRDPANCYLFYTSSLALGVPDSVAPRLSLSYVSHIFMKLEVIAATMFISKGTDFLGSYTKCT